MHIAIPTYNRPARFSTIDFLKKNNVPPDWITIFVSSEEQREAYAAFREYNIVVGVLGIRNQRNFITDYYPEDTYVICMDDDILDLKHRHDKPFLEWLDESVGFMKTSGLGLLTVPPSSNPFFFGRSADSFRCGNYLAVGVFHIYRNHRELKMTVDMVEDYDRSVMYLLRYGENIRYLNVLIKTKYWATSGGLAEMRTRDSYLTNVEELLKKYPYHLSSKPKRIRALDKDNPLPNVVIRKKTLPIPDTDIWVRAEVDPGLFDTLIEMLSKVKFHKRTKYSGYRHGFPDHYALIFGITRRRYTGRTCNSAITDRQPEIWAELCRLATALDPAFKFSSVHINRNIVCPPHKDSNNVGKSMIVSVGKYSGCKLVIEGVEYNTYCRPVVFNGAFMTHWNTDDLDGLKYSIIFYNL